MPVPGQVTNVSFALAPPATGGQHAYFDSLVARADRIAAYSLRDAAQIAQYRGPTTPPAITYVYPNDPDPRRQDAAKIAIPGNSLSTGYQVWLPTNHTPRTNLLVTWDAWYGAEMDYSRAQIPVWKGWNLCSPGSGIYTEFKPWFEGAKKGTASPGVLAYSCIRQYDGRGPNVVMGPVMNGRNYGSDQLGPMVAEFGQRAETWTRHWLYLEDDTTWYRLSLWMADKNQGPIRIYDKLQVKPREVGVGVSMNGVWGILRVEYNTSKSLVTGTEPRPLINYARNVVMLKGLSEAQVLALLQRPV